MFNLGWNYDYLTRCKAYRLFAFFLIPTLTCRADEELTAAGGLYARMWADYNQAVQWKITSEQ